ncbi:hypothetical protein EHQ46_10895 [Leptospira yanagawae]|uniref:Lipoprotein n=1 Tax=Leptospira yanagawae TaxID=293069 RepID=A0ABY2LZX0_9LEPT|nr:hypothetical protein [Leptospira yanagawae]TGL19896.1 hypothetical protein EHQ46_10895 [Leptospira yanagawae]
MKAKTQPTNRFKHQTKLLCLVSFLVTTTYNCASSLYPVKASIEKKEPVAVFINLVESKPVLNYKGNMNKSSKNITEFDELFTNFKQLAQKELPSVKIVEPKSTPQEILGTTIYTYDFGKTGAKIGIEFITATNINLSNEQEFTSENLKQQSWTQTTKVTVRFREVNGDRLGNYLGSRTGYELGSVVQKGSCPVECSKNANTMIEVTAPGKQAAALKSQLPENIKKVIQEIMASKLED